MKPIIAHIATSSPFVGGILLLIGALVSALSMAATTGLSKPDFVQNYPGASHTPGTSRRAFVPDDEGQLARHSSRLVSRTFGRRWSWGFGNGMLYSAVANSGGVTETKDNTATITIVAGGMKFLTVGAGAADDVVAVSQEPFTLIAKTNPDTGRAMNILSFLVAVSSVTNVGWQAGFATAGGNELFTADAADQCILVKAKAANTYSLRVTENGNAAVVGVVSLPAAPVADAQNLITLKFEVGTDTAGKDCILEVWCDETQCAVTNQAALRQALFTQFNTTAPSLQAQVGMRVNDAAARYAIFKVLGEVD